METYTALTIDWVFDVVARRNKRSIASPLVDAFPFCTRMLSAVNLGNRQSRSDAWVRFHVYHQYLRTTRWVECEFTYSAIQCIMIGVVSGLHVRYCLNQSKQCSRACLVIQISSMINRLKVE